MFKALDKRDGKIVAIKVLEVENEDTLELMKEINILKECNSDYIVRYKGSYEHDGNIWIAMEYAALQHTQPIPPSHPAHITQTTLSPALFSLCWRLSGTAAPARCATSWPFARKP